MLRNPRVLAVITVFLWGFGSAVTKTISSSSVFLTLTMSIALSACSFLVLILSGGNSSALFLPFRLVCRYVLVGFLGYGWYWLCYTQSFRHSESVATSGVLNYTWPLFTVVFTELLDPAAARLVPRKRSAKKIQWLGILLGTLAVWILVTRGNIFSEIVYDPMAIAWGLGAGISYGLFGALSSTVPGEHQLSFLFYASAGSTLLLLPFAAPEFQLLPTLPWSTLGVVVASGVLLDGVGYYSWTMANRLAREEQLDIAKVSSITLALPFLSCVIISLIYQQNDLSRWYFILAVALLTVSSTLCQQSERLASRTLSIYAKIWHTIGRFFS